MRFEELICYPKFSKEEFEKRYAELKSLGIEELVEGGRTIILGYKILGKGTTSLVIKAIYKGKTVALKIRRTDSNRESMYEEAKILEMLKNKNIAPELFAYSKNFIVMEYLEGRNIDEFIMNANSIELIKAIKKLIEHCIILDKLGIDHGDLSNASDHVIVYDDEVRIIDFESASLNRKPQNLTSIISYLFLSKKPFSNKLLEAFNLSRIEVLEFAREYKKGNIEPIMFLIRKLENYSG
jgi:putative serine/threonine protein kinase